MIVIISIFYLVYLLLFLSEELHREISINNSVVKLMPKWYNPKSQTINNNSLLWSIIFIIIASFLTIILLDR